jgi:hypothetical protein
LLAQQACAKSKLLGDAGDRDGHLLSYHSKYMATLELKEINGKQSSISSRNSV